MYTKKQIIDGYTGGVFTAREVLNLLSMTERQAAFHFGVTLRTLQRWKERNRLPCAVVLAMRYYVGDLSGIGQGVWSGFTIDGDMLSDDYGNRISKSDVLKHNSRMYRFVTMERELELKRIEDRAKADAPAKEDAPTKASNVSYLRPVK